MSLALFGKSFRHGIHPDEQKLTASLPIRRMPFVSRYVLPLAQHLGAPSRPVVRAGERVRRGQLVAEAAGFVSTCLHSPVTGRVTAIAPRRAPNGQLAPAIEIEADPFSSQRIDKSSIEPLSLERNEFVQHIQRAGLVGLGGAAFPSHVKYAPSKDKSQRVRWLVINGCECEPFLTADHRMMVERPDDIIRGIRILADQLDAEQTKVGVELNKPDAILALRRAAGDDPAIEIVPLVVKYPQGAEKMLIHAIFGVAVPAGKLPLDIEMVVNNVGTMAAIADSFEGQPLIERVVTVAGPGVRSPANLLVPLGTPVGDVLAHCDLDPDTRQVVMGGPMMGQPLASLEAPVVKGTSGLLAFTSRDLAARVERECIRCGRCLEACANQLNPSRLARLARARRYDEMLDYFVLDCMECGACTFTCPSGVPIVQLIRVAKGVLRERKAKEAKG
jgi:Na+-translocating ferredoxin:NAD+ oxidoreductase subunit C